MKTISLLSVIASCVVVLTGLLSITLFLEGGSGSETSNVQNQQKIAPVYS